MNAPEPPAERLLLLFASIHDVIAAEARVKQAALWCDLVPAPRALSSNCGMVLELGWDGWERLGELLAVEYRLQAAVACQAGGYRPWWPPPATSQPEH